MKFNRYVETFFVLFFHQSEYPHVSLENPTHGRLVGHMTDELCVVRRGFFCEKLFSLAQTLAPSDLCKQPQMVYRRKCELLVKNQHFTNWNVHLLWLVVCILPKERNFLQTFWKAYFSHRVSLITLARLPAKLMPSMFNKFAPNQRQ